MVLLNLKHVSSRYAIKSPNNYIFRRSALFDKSLEVINFLLCSSNNWYYICLKICVNDRQFAYDNIITNKIDL